MVPSISPFPVLLECEVVRGVLPSNAELLILNYCLWAADTNNYSIYKIWILQVHFSFFFFFFFILFYYLRWPVCVFCTFVLYWVCSGCCRDYRCLVFSLMLNGWRRSSEELLAEKKKKKKRYINVSDGGMLEPWLKCPNSLQPGVWCTKLCSFGRSLNVIQILSISTFHFDHSGPVMAALGWIPGLKKVVRFLFFSFFLSLSAPVL